MTGRDPALPDKVYVELVRTLFAQILPSIIMTGIFVLTMALVYREVGGPIMLGMGIVGLVVSAVRLSIAIGYRREALTAELDKARARRLELLFGAPYIAFAFCLGAFGARVMMLGSAEAHMITVCMLVGYCAGVATGTGLRPKVAIPSMMLALVPASVAAIGRGDPIYAGMAVCAMAFLFGGIRTVLGRAATMHAEIAKRLTFGSLARSDELTALPNRLGLQEYFDENMALLPDNTQVAVHYIDLDGFKPVNDLYGHAVGDTLLGAVGERLRSAIRNGDIAARIGGDEFVVLQFGLTHSEQAGLLAKRIAAAIEQPFRIGDRTIGISASIGTAATSQRSTSLDALMQQADEKLYAMKRARTPRRAA